jgi:protein-disulfide isomerase
MIFRPKMSNEPNQNQILPTSKNHNKSDFLSWLKTNQIHINSGLALMAFGLAITPYVFPKASEQIVASGLNPIVFDNAVIAYQGHKEAETKQAQVANLERIKSDLSSNPDLLTVDAGDSIIGPRNAPTKIFVFLDYNCGACRAVDPKILEIIKQTPGTALVVKHYPVITDQSSMMASLALAAHDLGQFEKAHLALFSQKSRSLEEALRALAQAGLDPNSIYKRSQYPSVKARIDQSLALGDRLQLEGTPAYIIGNVLIPGGDVAQIKTVLKATQAGNRQRS